MQVIQWFLNNRTLTIAGIAVVLVVGLFIERDCHGDARYEEGVVAERARILSVPPDTVVRYVPAIPVPATAKKATGKKVPLTVDYQAKINAAVEAAKDSLEAHYRDALNPFETTDQDSAKVELATGESFYVPYFSHVTAYPLDRTAKALLQLLPFDIPVKEIKSFVPIESSTAFADLLYSFTAGIMATLILLFALGHL